MLLPIPIWLILLIIRVLTNQPHQHLAATTANTPNLGQLLVKTINFQQYFYTVIKYFLNVSYFLLNIRSTLAYLFTYCTSSILHISGHIFIYWSQYLIPFSLRETLTYKGQVGEENIQNSNLHFETQFWTACCFVVISFIFNFHS